MRHRAYSVFSLIVCLSLSMGGCARPVEETTELRVPRGYAPTLEVGLDGRVMSFGPFVGYYFKPPDPRDLSQLHFLCFNERSFYTRDRPENTLLFEGEARLTELPDVGFDIPAGSRINPVFREDIPAAWLATRPEPHDHYRHFHSGYDASGPLLAGYWIKHVAVTSFVYDMGGRVDRRSPLYHRVTAGPDSNFAGIVEFDRGP